MIWRLLREELARGASQNIAFILGNLGLQVGVSLLLAVYLGPQGLGAFAVGMLVFETAMVIVHLPGVAFVREFSSVEREEALATVAALKLLLAFGCVVAIVAVAEPLGAALAVPPGVFRLLALVPPVTAVSSVAVMVFESRRDMVKRNLPGLAENGGRLAALVGVAGGAFALATRPETAALVWILGTLPSVALALGLHAFPDPRRMHLSKAREFFAFGWRTTLAQIIHKQLMWVGTLSVYLVFLAASPTSAQVESGLFKVAFSLMFYVTLFGGAVSTMVYPMMSKAAHEADEARRRDELHRLLSLAFFYELLIAVPLCAALALLAPAAFEWVLPDFRAAAPLAQLLAFCAVLIAVTLPVEVLLPAVNRPGLVLRLVAVQGLVAVALNALLVPLAGSPIGGPTGAVIAVWVTSAVGAAYGYALVRSIGVRGPSWATFRAVLAEHLARPAGGT